MLPCAAPNCSTASSERAGHVRRLRRKRESAEADALALIESGALVRHKPFSVGMTKPGKVAGGLLNQDRGQCRGPRQGGTAGAVSAGQAQCAIIIEI